MLLRLSVAEVGITKSAKPSYFGGRFCRVSLRAVRWVFAAALLTISGPVVREVQGQTDQVVNLSVDDPRPVAKALGILEAQYGWIATYEDPPYIHQGDIQDVTEHVRKDLDKYPKGKAPRVIGPKGGQININYILNSQTGKPDNPVQLIQQILDDHATRGNPGVFRLMQTGQIFHVVPAMVKNSQGQWVAQRSVLDARIRFPEEDRDGLETLTILSAAVSQATQTELVLGTSPINFFFHYRSRDGAANETARDVLVRFLQATNTKFSWRLFYGPGEKQYVLNIHSIDSKSWHEFILKQP
jgi:hypothetical protein